MSTRAQLVDLCVMAIVMANKPSSIMTYVLQLIRRIGLVKDVNLNEI